MTAVPRVTSSTGSVQVKPINLPRLALAEFLPKQPGVVDLWIGGGLPRGKPQVSPLAISVLGTRTRGGDLPNPLLVGPKKTVVADPANASVFGHPEAVRRELTERAVSWFLKGRDLDQVVDTALRELGNIDKFKQLTFEEQVAQIADAGDFGLRSLLSTRPDLQMRYPVICDVAAYVNVKLFEKMGIEAYSTTVPNLHWWTEAVNPRTGEVIVVDPTYLQFGNTALGSPVSRYALAISEITQVMEKGMPSEGVIEAMIARLSTEYSEAVRSMPDYLGHGPLAWMQQRLLEAIAKKPAEAAPKNLDLLGKMLDVHHDVVIQIYQAKRRQP
jgi:hypothetical protein